MNKNIGTSGHTIMTEIITIAYQSLLGKAVKIAKGNEPAGSDLFHYVICKLFSDFNLNKITAMCNSERKRIECYIVSGMKIQYYSPNSDFNKKYNFKYEDYKDIDFVDDYNEVEEFKKIQELKYDCLVNGLNYITINPPHKRFFFIYLFNQIVKEHKTVNQIGKELNVPVGTLYRNYHELSSKLIAYVKEKCNDL